MEKSFLLTNNNFFYVSNLSMKFINFIPKVHGIHQLSIKTLISIDVFMFLRQSLSNSKA